MESIKFKSVNKSYNDIHVLNNITFDIENKKIICIVGPSGCGKSTILNILSGRFEPDSGKIINLKNEKISYVFQKPRLIPWLTLEQNMEFVLDKNENTNNLISNWLDMVELSGMENFYPSKLSGGMEQRAALARAFIVPSDMLLMDEPFKGLDEPLRLRMVNLVYKLWKAEPKTIVFVTHDIREALLLGDKIIVLKEKPSEVLEEIYVNIFHEERHIGCNRLSKMEEYIYKIINDSSKENVKLIKDKICLKIKKGIIENR